MTSRVKSVLGDFLTYALNGVFVNVVAIIALPVITRVFSVEEFGAVETIQSSAVLLPAIIGLGYDIAVMKELLLEENAEKQRDTVFTLSVALALWGGVVIGAGVLFSKEISLIVLKNEQYAMSVTLALLAIYSNIFFGLALQLMRVEFKVKRYTFINVGQAVCQYGLIIILIAPLGLGVEGYFSASLISSVAWTIASIVLTRKYYRGRFDSKVLRSLLFVGIPVTFASLAYWVINFSDRVLLTQLGSLAEAGYYSMAVKVIAVVTMVVTAFSKSWTPRAFQFYREKPDEYLEFTNTIHVYVAAFITTVALGNIAFARILVFVFATDEYIPSVGITVPLAFAGVLQCLSQFSCMGIYFKDHTADIGKASWMAALVNVAINVLFIPVIGAMAAGISTLASYLFLYLYYRSRTDKYLRGTTRISRPLAVVSIGAIFGVMMGAFQIENIILDCGVKLLGVMFFIGIICCFRLISLKGVGKAVKRLKEGEE